MAFLNACGNPVATKPQAIQITVEVPTEEVHSLGTPNWGGVISAGFQIIMGIASKNPTAIAQGIQALLAALSGS